LATYKGQSGPHDSDPEADIGRENRIQGSRFQIAVREAKISLRSFALALLFCGTISTMTVADEVKRISVNGTERPTRRTARR
jgi:hypothetical protein